MSYSVNAMRDPTAETEAVERNRIPPKTDLSNATIGLLSISKERSAEFLDSVEKLLAGQGHTVLRFEKPTHTKPAPEGMLQDIVECCVVVVEGLAD